MFVSYFSILFMFIHFSLYFSCIYFVLLLLAVFHCKSAKLFLVVLVLVLQTKSIVNMADFTEEEVNKMVESFKQLGVKPKAGSAEDLRNWMLGVVASGELGDVKVPIDVKGNTYRPPPRISLFSGTAKDTAFDLWKYEVNCLISENTYSPEEILLAIRRSVKDNAARVLMHMGKGVTVQNIITKFDSVFGSIDRGQSLLSAFYSAKQEVSEDVTTFASRLEDLLSKAVEAGYVKPTDTNSMLCSSFYTGLNSQLKSISGYKFEKYTSFDELLVEVRRLESEFPPKPTHVKSMSTQKDEQIEKLTGMVNQLRSEVRQFQSRYEDRGHFSGRGRSFQRGYQGRRFNSNNRYRQRQTHEQTQSQSDKVTCYRCGQEGHVRSGCRNKYDKDGKPLNLEASTKEGRS